MTEEEYEALGVEMAEMFKGKTVGQRCAAVIIIYNTDTDTAQLVAARTDLESAHSIMRSVLEQEGEKQAMRSNPLVN